MYKYQQRTGFFDNYTQKSAFEVTFPICFARIAKNNIKTRESPTNQSSKSFKSLELLSENGDEKGREVLKSLGENRNL